MESRVDACHPERSRGICTWTFLLPSNYGTRILNGDYAERAGSTPLRVEFHTAAQRFSASTVPKSLMVRWRDLSATRSDPAASAKSVLLSAFRRCRALGTCRSLDSLRSLGMTRAVPHLLIPASPHPRESLVRHPDHLEPRRQLAVAVRLEGLLDRAHELQRPAR